MTNVKDTPSQQLRDNTGDLTPRLSHAPVTDSPLHGLSQLVAGGIKLCLRDSTEKDSGKFVLDLLWTLPFVEFAL